MSDEQDKAAEVQPAPQTTIEAAPAPEQAAAPVETPAPAEKPDINRVIEEDGYLEQVLGNAKEEPPAAEKTDQADAPAAKAADPAPAEGSVIVVRYDGTEERIPIQQATRRLQLAQHLQIKYEREAAPVLRVLQQRPDLAAAVQEAIEGKSGRLDKLAETAGKTVPDVDQRVLDRARKDPRLEHLSDEELVDHLQTMQALAAAAESQPGEASTAPEVVAKQVRQEVQTHLGALAAANPDHEETMGVVRELVASMKEGVDAGRIHPDVYDETIRMMNDPRERDENGVPLFYGLYKDAKAELARRRQPAPAAPAAPAKREKPSGVSARLAPGPAATVVGAPAGGPSFLPQMAGKTLEERRAMLDAFLDS